MVVKTTPRKKAEIKVTHAKAIKAYRDWLEFNPKATKVRKVAMFDAFVDSAYLDALL
jgi:hypothetical protein